MRIWRISLLIAGWMLAVGWTFGADSTETKYTLLDPQLFKITNKFRIENITNNQLVDIVATVQVGAESDSLYQQKVTFFISPKPSKIEKDALGNIIATIKWSKITPKGVLFVSVDKYVKNSGINYTPELMNIMPDYQEFLAVKGNEQFLKPSVHIESDNPQIMAEALKVPRDLSVFNQALRIFYGVNTIITYDTSETYAHTGALKALQTRRGVCTEFSALFVAFCRALGIPARVVSGYWLIHEVTPVNVPIPVHEDRHAWPEFYVPTIGWVPAEPSALQMYQNTRIPNLKYLANIQTDSRHLIWSYGLETERAVNLDVNYAVYRPIGDNGEGDDITVDMSEETVTLLPPLPATK